MTNEIKFLSDEIISSELNELILNSKHKILICNPWLDPEHHVIKNLIAALNKKTSVEIITLPPSKEKYRKALNKLSSNGAKIYFVENLHAKIFVFDFRYLIIGSTNLNTTSLGRNHEAALYTNKIDVIDNACEYIDELKKNSQEMEIQEKTEKIAETKETKEIGFCIQCSIEKEMDIDKPLCMECWKENRHKYKWREVCHKCGKKAKVSVNRPLCDECYYA